MAADSRRLQNVLTRHQVYLEGVKVWFAQQFTRVLQELTIELRKIFARLPYDTLDALTKAQLQAFVRQLREIQNRTYNRYVETLLLDLQSFMKTNLDVSKTLFASFARSADKTPLGPDELLGNFFGILNEWEKENEERSGIVPFIWLRGGEDNLGKLWGTAKNAPIPASGLTLGPFISAFTGSAIGTVTNAALRGYANKEKVNAVLSAITGSVSKNFRDGSLARVNAQGAAVVDTLVQHVDSIVESAIASVFYNEYQWLSVIDSVTSDICRSRNKKIYQYGKGPLPPAHIRCRSKTAPYVGRSEDGPRSFNAWIKSQPRKVREDMGDDIRMSALTLKQFRAKLSLMLEDDD